MPLTCSTRRGWVWDAVNSELEVEVNGTKVLGIKSSALTITPATTITGAATLSSTLTVAGLLTASAALTATTGDVTATAGDVKVTAANVKLLNPGTFGTTQPTGAVIMKAGTAPAGAITTAGAIFSSATVVQKIIAAGTVSNVET